MAYAPSDRLSEWIAPRRAALLIIDMQVDFAAPEGVMGRAGLDLSAAPAALAAAERLAGAARRAGAPVIFAGMQTTPETDSAVWNERLVRLGVANSFGAQPCPAGCAGAEFYGPRPRGDDAVVAKTRYSAFFGTRLDALLKAAGVDTLVVCGMTTECCVDCSVRDAFHLDYHVFLAADACAAYQSDLHEAALVSLQLNCAMLVTADQVEAAWSRTGC